MTRYQQVAADLVWRAEMAGLEVHEPQTVLEVNLLWHAWTDAVRAQDDLADYANKHKELK